MTIGLLTPRDFLNNVVDPDMAAFAAQAELRLACHACTSLFSLRDWVYEFHKNNGWTFRGAAYPPIGSKTKFFQDLCTIEPDFEMISDIANATKHMILDTSRRLTNLHGAANVHVMTVGGAAPGSTPSARVFVQIGPGFYDVLQAATKVHDLWKVLFAENNW